MSDHSDAVLRQFGEDAGFEGLAFNAHDHVVVHAKSTARLFGLERTEREILIYVTMPLDYDAGDWMMRAYRRAHHTLAGQWPVQPALRITNNSRSLLVLTRLPRKEFVASRLQQTLVYLNQWLDTLCEQV